MLKSHNDSAVAIAEHISGSVEAFAEKMNEKAKELGCKDTHFVTPNGLDGEDEAVSIIQQPGILPDHGVCNKKMQHLSISPRQEIILSRISQEKSIIRYIIPMLSWIWKQE